MYLELQAEGYTEVNIMGINGFQYLDNDYHCMVCDDPQACSTCDEIRVLPWVQDLDDDDEDVVPLVDEQLIKIETNNIEKILFIKQKFIDL